MTALAAGKAYLFRDFTLTLGAVAYANASTTAQLKPDTSISTLKTLVPDGVIQDVDTTVWTFSLAGVADWGPSGLAKYLNDNNGVQVPVVLTPKTAGPSATFNIIAMPVPFGGDQGSWNVFAATDFAVVGQPVFDDGESS